MLVYKIPYNRDKYPNALTDFLDFIKLIKGPATDYCLFIISKLKSNSVNKYSTPPFLHIIFDKKHLDHFSTLLSVYKAKKLKKPPFYNTASLLAGNGKLLMDD